MKPAQSAAPGAAMSRRERRQARRLRRLFRKQSVRTAPEGLDADGRALAAIEALPEPVRDAFILARFEEWPCSSIADHLRLAAPDVEHAIAQALYALLQARAMQDASACRECVGQTVRAALADFDACRAECEAAGDWPLPRPGVGGQGTGAEKGRR